MNLHFVLSTEFVSIISEPLTEDFNDILKTKSKEVVDICRQEH